MPIFRIPAKAAAALLLAAFFPESKVQAAPDRPNILLIVSDDHAFTDYGFMGHEKVKTPNLDRLAKESLLFRRGYATSSLCCPSLAAVLTGKYPHQTKITGNEPPIPKKLNPTNGARPNARYRDADFLAEVVRLNSFITEHPRIPAELGKLGYSSFQTGKWWAGNFASGGFTHGMSHGEQGKGGRHGDEGLAIGRKTLQPIYDFIADATTEAKPWFVWYAPMLPHDPHTPPQEILDKYIPLTPSLHQARYWANVEFFDQTCGQLLEHLDKRKIAENTLVIYVTDNGWIQNLESPKFRPDSKLSQYDTGLRTPIMFRWLGKILAQDCTELASIIDVFPTICHLLGHPTPTGLPGINLLDANARSSRPAIFGECHLHNAVSINEPSKNLLYRWTISQEGWKLILPHNGNVTQENKPGRGIGPELYHVGKDPLESDNLYLKEQERVKVLEAGLNAWWRL